MGGFHDDRTRRRRRTAVVRGRDRKSPRTLQLCEYVRGRRQAVQAGEQNSSPTRSRAGSKLRADRRSLVRFLRKGDGTALSCVAVHFASTAKYQPVLAF